MCSPAVHVAATTTLPHGVDELAFAGGIEGRPIELVQCETVDLQVPANAEWVIEGEVVPEEQGSSAGTRTGSATTTRRTCCR
jgi:4-hydroxy-3-polyprenylbenzoate decarboxylase